MGESCALTHSCLPASGSSRSPSPVLPPGKRLYERARKARLITAPRPINRQLAPNVSCRSDPVSGSVRPPAAAGGAAGEEDWLPPAADEEVGEAAVALVVLDPGVVEVDPEPLPAPALGLVALELFARTTIDPCMKGWIVQI